MVATLGVLGVSATRSVSADASPPAQEQLVWERLAPLPIAVRSPAAVAVDGQIYVIGGADASNRQIPTVQIYDPRTDTWRLGADAPRGWDSHTAAVLDGRIHVISGYEESVGTQTAHWVFDPRTEDWSRRAPIPVGVNAAVTHVLGGRIYVLGGTVRQAYRNTVQVYDAEADAWHSGGTLPVATLSAVSAVIDGRVHLVGGGVPTYQTSDQHLIYDPAGQQFERAAPYPHLMEAGGGGVFGSTLCVFGGRIATPGRRNAPFPDGSCHAAGRWQPIPSMPTPRAEVAYLTLGSAIYAIGGDGEAGPANSVERLVMRRPIA